MKTKILIFTAFFTLTFSNAQDLFPTNQYNLNTSKSVLSWYGNSLFQFNEHHGTVQFKKGYLKIQDGKLWGGSFEVDMTTITAKDGGANSELDKHLKNEDFFDVKKFPTAWLSIQKVKHIDNGKYEIEANLNIKGITKPVLFGAELLPEGTTWKFTAKLIIDRTRWEINYGSNEGVMDPLRNYSISDAIKFDVMIITD